MATKGDWWWAGWLAGGLVTFAVLEGFAFAEYPDRRHTLTAVTRRWLGIYPLRPRRVTSSIGMAGGFAMLAAHFLTDPPRFARYTDHDLRFSSFTTADLPLSFQPERD